MKPVVNRREILAVLGRMQDKDTIMIILVHIFFLSWMITHQFSQGSSVCLNCKCAKVASDLGSVWSCPFMLGFPGPVLFPHLYGSARGRVFSHIWWWVPRWEHLKWSSLSAEPSENQHHCGVTSRDRWNASISKYWNFSISKYFNFILANDFGKRCESVCLAKRDSKGNPRKLGNFYRGWEAVVLAPCLWWF